MSTIKVRVVFSLKGACDWEGHVKGSQVAGKVLSPKQGGAYKNIFPYTNSLSWTIIFEILFGICVTFNNKM